MASGPTYNATHALLSKNKMLARVAAMSAKSKVLRDSPIAQQSNIDSPTASSCKSHSNASPRCDESRHACLSENRPSSVHISIPQTQAPKCQSPTTFIPSVVVHSAPTSAVPLRSEAELRSFGDDMREQFAILFTCDNLIP